MKQGEMELKLGDDNLVLRATPYALRFILSKHEDLRTAIQRVYMMNDKVIYDILEAGVTDGKVQINRKALEENAFNEGLINLIGPMTDFLMLLANGGKKPSTEKTEEDVSGKT